MLNLSYSPSSRNLAVAVVAPSISFIVCENQCCVSLKISAYILLEEENKAKEAYERLDESIKQEFRNYPICKFCKGLRGK